MKRFYKTVSTGESDAGLSLLLDGKPVRTPMKHILDIPSSVVGAAVVREWDSQKDVIIPQTMPVTQMLFTARDRVHGQEAAILEQMLHFVESDTILFFDPSNPALYARQQTIWQKIIDGVAQTWGVNCVVNQGVNIAAQSPLLHEKMEAYFGGMDLYTLTAAQNLVGLTGSPLLVRAAFEGELDADQLFEAAHLEELAQMEAWGADAEAQKRLDARKREIRDTLDFFRLTRS